jgi:hypothetical protein
MPRPMTVYRSGIRTLNRTRTEPCVVCGKPQTRTRTFTGVDVDEQYAAWCALTVYCIPCWRKAGRPAR